MRNIDLTDISFAKKKMFCVYQETYTCPESTATG